MVAVEISETAASLARENCERLVPGRVEVIHADATDPLVLHDLNGQVDVVVSNPPYVPAGAVEDTETEQHEPTVALYGGGPDGLEIPIDVLVRSVALLRTGGVLVMEHDHEQGGAAACGRARGRVQAGRDRPGPHRPRPLPARRKVGSSVGEAKVAGPSTALAADVVGSLVIVPRF